MNSEYQQKVDELTMTTNDLSNFLSSTMIGILFIDENFNIRKFTEYVGRGFQLMDHDVGRPIQIFADSFPDEDIVGDAESVLRNLTPIDREITAGNGRHTKVHQAKSPCVRRLRRTEARSLSRPSPMAAKNVVKVAMESGCTWPLSIREDGASS